MRGLVAVSPGRERSKVKDDDQAWSQLGKRLDFTGVHFGRALTCVSVIVVAVLSSAT